MFLLLLLAGAASAATLAQPSHHYAINVPYGWEQGTPARGEDFVLRPVGSTTASPLLTVMYESVNGQIDPYQIERNLRTGLSTTQGHTTIVVDFSVYNALTQTITVDYHAVEWGQTTKRGEMACKLGNGMMIACNLTSSAATFDRHKLALSSLVYSLRIDPGNELRTTLRPSNPAANPEHQRQSEPSAQHPEPTPTHQPASLLPYLLGGAVCSFTGIAVLLLGIVGIIVLSTRRKPRVAL
jgi:hypothetical protein